MRRSVSNFQKLFSALSDKALSLQPFTQPQKGRKTDFRRRQRQRQLAGENPAVIVEELIQCKIHDLTDSKLSAFLSVTLRRWMKRIRKDPFGIHALNLNHSPLRKLAVKDGDDFAKLADLQRISDDELSLIITNGAVKSRGPDGAKPIFF